MRAMSPRLLFIGAGAIGSYLGASRPGPGHDVTPGRPLARAGRGHPRPGPQGHRPARALRGAAGGGSTSTRRSGSGPTSTSHSSPIKAYDTAWATHHGPAPPGPAGYVVSAQNCWNDPGVAAIAGPERSVGPRHVQDRRSLSGSPVTSSAAPKREAALGTTSSAPESTTGRSRPGSRRWPKMLGHRRRQGHATISGASAGPSSAPMPWAIRSRP